MTSLCKRSKMQYSFAGFGSSFMFLAPISICVDNFSPRVRGAVIGLAVCFNTIGPSAFGAIYAGLYNEGPLGNFFLLIAIVCILVNLLSMWILRPIPLESEDNMQGEPIRNKVPSVCFLNDDGSLPADSWYMRLGIGVLKLPVFHILLWCNILSSVPKLAVMINITTMATSFGHHSLAVNLPIWGPILGLLTPAIGYISDRTLKYVSRLVYIVMAEVLLLLFFIVSIFQGNDSHIFSGLVLSSYILFGFHAALIPTLITEYFGSHYFMRIWGLQMLTNALLTLLMTAIVGTLYQNAITNNGTECYGLVCFQSTFILSSIMCAVSLLLCGILWNLERKQANGYERFA